jgi:hypothetical protein
MSNDDEDYLDDPEIVDFNEELDARASQSMEEDEIPTSPLMFGTIGRGSPEMDLKTPRVLYRDADKALRSEGINDDSHLKDPTNLVLNEQQQKEAEDAKRFDALIDRMYKGIGKPVARPKTNSSSKKGGTRKRSSRRTRRSRSRSRSRSRRNKKSNKKSRNKRR